MKFEKFEEPQIFNRPRNSFDTRKPMSKAREGAEALFAKPKKDNEKKMDLNDSKENREAA